MSKREQYVLLVLALVALAGFGWAARKSPGAAVKVPAAQTEDKATLGAFVPPPGVPDPSPHHVGPYGLVYTPHRYPATCGNDISVLIHRGYGVMSLPRDDESFWIGGPPSEAEL